MCPSFSALDGVRCWLNETYSHTIMQKDESKSRDIFILPKPVYKHEHNIRFLTPQSSGRRQIFSYSEKASANALGAKVENLKRDLLRFQMKSRLEERVTETEREDESTNGSERANRSHIEQSQRLNIPPLYSTALERSPENFSNLSQQPQSYAFAKPWGQLRMGPNKPPHQTLHMGKPGASVNESRHELNAPHEGLNSNTDPRYAKEGIISPKFILGSKFDGSSSSSKISFFKNTLPEGSSMAWKVPVQSRNEAVDIFRSKGDGTSLTSADRNWFEQNSDLTGGKSERGLFAPRSLLSLPVKGQQSAQRETEQETQRQAQTQQEPYKQLQQKIQENTVKTVNRYSLGIDARKRQLEHVQLYSKSGETKVSNGNGTVESGRFFLYSQDTAGSLRRTSELEPRRKLARHEVSGSESEENMQLIGSRERRTYYTDSKSSHDEVPIANHSPPDRSRVGSGRPTAVIRAGRKDELEVDRSNECGRYYKDVFIRSNNVRVNDCGCRECQSGYGASSYSLQKQSDDQLGHKNVDVLFTNREDFRHPAFKAQPITSLDELASRTSLKRPINSDSSRSRERPFQNDNRNENYYFPKNENTRTVRTPLDGLNAETGISERNERTLPGKKNQYVPYPEPNYALKSYSEANRANRNYPEPYYSYVNNPTGRYIHKTAGVLQRISSNESPDCGSPNSEKSLNPPRLISSNSRALETYREPGCEKSYSDMSQCYEMNSPRARTLENSYSGGEILRPGLRKKSHVVVMYSYPKRQRLIEKGENGPFIESVSYKIHEKVICVEDQPYNSGKLVGSRPNSKGSFVEPIDASLYVQSIKVEAKVRYVTMLVLSITHYFLKMLYACILLYSSVLGLE